MSTRENVKTTVFIKKTKLLSNGQAPVFFRISVDSLRSEFAIKRSVLPKHWDATKQRAKKVTAANQHRQARVILTQLIIKTKITRACVPHGTIFGSLRTKWSNLNVITAPLSKQSAKPCLSVLWHQLTPFRTKWSNLTYITAQLTKKLNLVGLSITPIPTFANKVKQSKCHHCTIVDWI